MKSQDVYTRFKELNINNEIHCMQDELDIFLMYGFLIKSGDSYLTRSGSKVNVSTMTVKKQNFNINLNNIINICEKISKETGEKRIYCMTMRCYNKMKETGHIITNKDKEYYRDNIGIDWLVNIV